MNFKLELTSIINKMAEIHNTAYGLYFELEQDVAVVHLLEEDGSSKVHERMHEIHTKISCAMGYPVLICHNSPTDGIIHVHGDREDSELYDPKTCCKANFIKYYHQWVELGRPSDKFNDSYRVSFETIELIGRNCSGAQYELDDLDYDKDIPTQLLNKMLEIFTDFDDLAEPDVAKE